MDSAGGGKSKTEMLMLLPPAAGCSQEEGGGGEALSSRSWYCQGPQPGSTARVTVRETVGHCRDGDLANVILNTQVDKSLKSREISVGELC